MSRPAVTVTARLSFVRGASVTDLARLLLERIADDEQVALAAAAAAPTPWETADRGWMSSIYRKGSDNRLIEIDQQVTANSNPGDICRHIERWDPARVLAECDAKRRLVALHRESHECPDGSGMTGFENPCRTLRLLAAPYSDHPSFGPAWETT